MILIFYGSNSRDWMDVLSPSLLPKINKILIENTSENIDSIVNIQNISILKSFIKTKNNYKIIPLLERHMKELYNANIKNVIMPKINTVYTFSNKKLFINYTKENNLDFYIPTTYYDFDQIPIDSQFIIKPYNNSNGNGIKIKNHITIDEFKNNIIQEYIENTEEYVSHVVAIDGKIIYCTTYKYIFDNNVHVKIYPLNTNNTIKIELNKKYIDIMEKFLTTCSYNGVCNIDFIITKEGDIKIFEINPRFGGSLIRSNDNDLLQTIINLIS